MSAHTGIREGDILQLCVEKLVYGGEGFAHHGTRACFVKNAIPGETVAARIERIRTQYIQCTAAAVIAASPDRTTPRCPITDACGGCQWQHISYPRQLYWKTNILKESLERIARIAGLQMPLPLACASPFEYRCRATLRVSGKTIGYYREKSRDVVPVQHCPVLAVPLNTALAVCRDMLQAAPSFVMGARDLQLLLIRATGDVLVSFGCGAKRINKFVNKSGATVLSPLDSDAVEMIEGMYFKRDAENFYQINFEQNLRLIRLVTDYLAPARGDAILELYCGSGNFSLFLAREGARVTGIESNSAAVREARANAALNSISTCRFERANVNRLDDSIFREKYHGVLLNPPRTGCPRELLANVASAQPGVIVYVSCNPATLSRDLRELVARGYMIREIQPVDMFPQTYHIETVVKLVRERH